MSERLSGIRLWVTRPEPAARRSARKFEAEGASCWLEATVSLQAASLQARDRAQLRAFLPGSRLLLSSANAARFLADAVASDRELRQALLQLPVSAVGESTARQAHSLGWRVDHVASISLGVEFARELMDRGAILRVVLPGSDRRRPEIETLLRENGVEVLPLCVYRTIPARSLSADLTEALTAGEFDASLVYSPSAVRGMLAGARARKLDAACLPPCLALGRTTGGEVKAQGLRLVAAPRAPGEDALLEAAVEWWSKRRANP
jgi:uroporphyrinogen-III synthase